MANIVGYAQEDGVTNAFLDLARKGEFSEEEESSMRKVASQSQMNELMKNAPSSGFNVPINGLLRVKVDKRSVLLLLWEKISV